MRFIFKSKKTLILWIGILLLVGVIVVLMILSKDEKSFDDSALILSPIEIDEHDNGFYNFSRAAEKVFLTVDNRQILYSMLQGKIWDNNLVEQVLMDNEEAIFYFRKAVDYPKFQLPDFQNMALINVDTPLPGLEKWRSVAEVVSLNSLYLFKQGREKEAFDDSVRLIKMGQLIGNSPRPNSIQYLIGILFQNFGIDRLKSMVPFTSLPLDDLKSYIKELDDTQIAKEQGGVIIKEEYMIINNSFDLLKRETQRLIEEESFPLRLLDKLSYYYKLNKTKKLFFEYYLIQSKNFDKKYYSETNFSTLGNPFFSTLGTQKFFTENLIGKIIYEYNANNFGGFFSLTCKQNFLINAIQVLIALKAYKIEKGETPASLNILTPNYISEVPIDPFDGRPIRFSIFNKTIYSVGEDLKENGGLNEEPSLLVEF